MATADNKNKNEINKIINSVNVQIKEFNSIYYELDGVTFILFAWNFKDEIINESDIPIKHKTLLTTLLLYLLKLLHYQLPLIPKNIYVQLKRYVLNEMMVKKESVFLLLKQR